MRSLGHAPQITRPAKQRNRQNIRTLNEECDFRDAHLLEVGAEICERKKTAEGDGRGQGTGTEGYFLNDVLDKVVQDDNNTEGTFFWSVMEAADRQVSALTIAASQFFRVASGDRSQRVRVTEKLKVASL